MQCACAILSCVACLTRTHFSIFPQKGHDFRKEVIEHKMCVLIFATNFIGNMSHEKT